nr:unnamed protein product [Digitaria exilis]
MSCSASSPCLSALGTIVRLLGKQSQMGCLDEVYKSVEDLSSDYFQTKACKAMLLKPLNTASSHCHRLKINIDDTKPREVYVCKDTSCYAHCAFSSVPDTLCKCGKVMEYAGDRPEDDAKTAAAGSENGVFVKGNQKFITTDDLQVAPASTSLMLSLGREFGVQDPADLEQTILQLTSEKSSNRDAYVKQGSQSFMVTDDLHVRPLTLDSSLRVVSEGEVQMKDLVEKEVAVTKFQIMELQRAALMTREALSSVLLPPKKKKKNLKHLMY